MSRRRWFVDYQPVTARVETGGHVHRVSWRSGRLILHDHPDLVAEEVLHALGGERCPCLFLRDAFRGLGAAEPALPGPARLRVAVRGGLRIWRTSLGPLPPARPAVIGRPISPAARMLQSLQADPTFLKLPVDQRQRVLSGLRSRAAMETVPDSMTTLLARINQLRTARRLQRIEQPPRDKPDAESLLQHAAMPALEAALRHARANLRAYAPLEVDCWKQLPDMQRQLDGRLSSHGGSLAVSLPVRWLNRVWLRGLACVDGHFVLDVDAPQPATTLQAEAVRWEHYRGGTSVAVAAPCLIWRSAGAWHLAWSAWSA